jgi:hypothetical protein
MPKFIFKANNNVLSHCDCTGEPGTSSSQLDCPWCGCGWLICCSRCGKAFTYAEIRETDTPLVELGRREVLQRGLANVTDQEIEEWAEANAKEFDRFEVGQIVVYLDGEYFPLDAKDVAFEGYYARHDLAVLPHAEALNDPQALRSRLGDKSYWLDRERPNRG